MALEISGVNGFSFISLLFRFSFLFLVNRILEGYFQSNRDLRQWDPFSPLLFVIVIEAFSGMLEKAVGEILIKSFMVDQLQVPHLLFANDTLILCDVDAKQFKNLHTCSYL